MKIGLFGGSFNPIHNAHVQLAHTIRTTAKLDEVWFLVSPQNPFKTNSTDLADEQIRFEMTRLALRRYRRLKASDYEFHLPRPSYTWNTLQHLRADFPDDTFYIIIGADNWVAFDRWAHAEDILREYNIIVYPRENSPIDEASLPANVTLIKTPLINITSTMIREALGKGQDVSSYVNPNVLRFIKKYALFAHTTLD